MEKTNLATNRIIRLPPGYRFRPTDEELLIYYLKPKVLSYPLPSSIISEVNVCKYNPWDLPGDSEEDRYFFSTREVKYRNGNRTNRATHSGYWRTTGRDKQILAFRSNQVVGMKKTLVFYRGKPPNGSKTDWIMHEYRLVGSCISPQRNNSTQNSMMQMEDWVVCRIFQKKRNTRNDDNMKQPCNNKIVKNLKVSRPSFIDFMRLNETDPCHSSSSSASSGITEVSSTGSDHEENSGCNSVSSSCRIEP